MGIHYVFFADELGIASVYPALKKKLAESRYKHVSLLYCSSNNRHIFQKEMEILQRHFPSQLFVSYHSNEFFNTCLIGKEDIEAVMNANTMPQMDFTISGNEAFVEEIKELLLFLGIEKVRIQEQYFSE